MLKIAADKHSSLFWLKVSDEDKKVFKRFHQIENDALTREVAILKETTKVSNIWAISFRTFLQL
jgi:hypothetical protein